MSKVALLRCENYNYSIVKEAIRKGIRLLGGPQCFAAAGEKILLKPNILTADPPEKCVTTHPAVLKAVAEIFKEAGAVVSFGDSPAVNIPNSAGLSIHSPRSAAKKAGLLDAAKEIGVELADFENGNEVYTHKDFRDKSFVIAKGILENDGLISLPKLKTHSYQKMTGCIKNQFGCIPGVLKGEYHVKYTDVNDFARMLVELNILIKPRLFVMDGIYAMEGDGPRGGTPKKMNLLLLSSDPVALDATVCRIINLDPTLVPTTKIGMELGLGTHLINEIEIVGDEIKSFYDFKFNVVREPLKSFKQGTLTDYFRNKLVPKPYILKSKCIRCGVCVRMCPVKNKAVDWHERDKTKAPSYNYKRCIRCYCCQELCPENAIKLKVSLLRKLFRKLNIYKNYGG